MKLKTSLLYNGFISIIQSVNSGAEGGICQTKQSQLPPAGALRSSTGYQLLSVWQSSSWKSVIYMRTHPPLFLLAQGQAHSQATELLLLSHVTHHLSLR